MEIIVLRQVERELREAPKKLREDIYSLFTELTLGKKLAMPLSRPLPSIARGLYELRLSGKAGEFRVFYLIKVNDAIYIIHAAAKKRQTIDKVTSELLRKRVRGIDP